MPGGGVYRGGAVCFGAHIGRPLTDQLWEDLNDRLCVTNLRIYFPEEDMWMDCVGPGGCTILLTADGIVKDIMYNPRFPRRIRRNTADELGWEDQKQGW